MKAYLLAAGFGTRLRPLTDTTPKCLIPIQNKPLLEWWCDLFLKHGIDQVLINTHHLAEQVRAYIADYNRRNTNLILYEFFEPELLGSGGTIKANQSFVSGEDIFYICYADNFTQIDLTALRTYHGTHKGYMTMALSPSNTPDRAGIATLGDYNKIIEFEEKPENPKSNLANAGVYIADQRIFDYFPNQKTSDFAKDVCQRLVGNMYGYHVHEYHLDVGTPENLERARYYINNYTEGENL